MISTWLICPSPAGTGTKTCWALLGTAATVGARAGGCAVMVGTTTTGAANWLAEGSYTGTTIVSSSACIEAQSQDEARCEGCSVVA